MPASPFFQDIYGDTKIQSNQPPLSTMKSSENAPRTNGFFDPKDAYRAAELSIELQIERMHLTEAISARDTLAERLHEAYSSLNQKTQTLVSLALERDNLERELQNLRLSQRDTASNGFSANTTEMLLLRTTVSSLSKEISSIKKHDKENQESLARIEPPSYEAEQIARPHSEFGRPVDMNSSRLLNSQLANPLSVPSRPTTSPPMPSSLASPYPALIYPTFDNSNTQRVFQALTSEKLTEICYHEAPLFQEDGETVTNARYARLSLLPLPPGIPEDALTPIVIPNPFTLNDFLGTIPPPFLSTSVIFFFFIFSFVYIAILFQCNLSNHIAFQESTTRWCPDREEHGFLLAPAFKCTTNPRVNTAHRWAPVDVFGKLNQPIDCFYHRDGKWYYAGVYQAQRLADLTPKEWETLSSETTQAVIKDTLTGRKNISPQNIYETGQLYAAGALKVACIALQCVGFNETLYRVLLDAARRCEESGQWRALGQVSGTIAPSTSFPPPGTDLSSKLAPLSLGGTTVGSTGSQ